MKHLKKFEQVNPEWDMISDYMDSLDYDQYIIEVAEMYGWEDDSRWQECESEHDWYDSYSYFAEDDILSFVMDELKRRFKDVDLSKYESEIEKKVSENV